VDFVMRVQATTLGMLLALPAPVQRALAGRPLTIDGATLATETQLTLRLKRVVRDPAIEELPIAHGRDVLRRQCIVVGGRQPIAATRDLAMDDLSGRLYVPRGAATPGPLLVWLHGGGFVYGDLDSHDAVCRFLAERAGVRVLAVDYRLAPEHPFPAAYDDARAAHRWVVENAASLGADPERLALGGDSAGATLSAVAAIAAARDGLPLAFQLLLYPSTDQTTEWPSRARFGDGLYLTTEFMDVAKCSYLPDPATWGLPEVSPLLAELPPGLAPAYVATAGFDPLRDEGEAYVRKLADAGVDVTLRRYADQIHGFVNIVGVGRTSRAAVIEVAAALRRGLA
jgi:acetyl esterase